MSEYTPDTEEVRDRYAYDAEEHTPYLSIEKARAQFDRWLATHDEQTRADERRRIAEEIRYRQHGWRPGASANFKRGFVLGLRAAAQIAERSGQ